jgi:fermentation-respiration switch protein FrsA (DUF1100 family)
MDQGLRMLKKLAVASGALILSAGVLLYSFQNKMIYLPDIEANSSVPEANPKGYRNPGERRLRYSNVWLTTEDDMKLQAWLVMHSSHAPTLIFFTENAGNMGLRMDSIHQFVTELEFNVFILSYRGYGNSSGSPTERGLELDIRAAVKYVFEEAPVDRSQVFLFGRSLGGAAAIYAASCIREYPYRGVIVENTFTSIDDIVDHLMPRLVAWAKAVILSNHWPSLARIPLITAPMLFISGRKDELVPPTHMDRLYEAATGARFKELHRVAEGDHNSTWRVDPHYQQWIRDFTQRC